MTILIPFLMITFNFSYTESNTDSDIWGHRVIDQKFDKKPFREIQIPQWLQNTTNYCYGVQNNWQQGIKHGVQMGEVAFGRCDTLLYDSKLIEILPHIDPVKLDKTVAQFKKNKVRCIAAFPPCYQLQMAKKHPEWRKIDTKGGEIPEVPDNNDGNWLCQIGRWGDLMIDLMEEILVRYDVDGFGFDGIHHRDVCYCKSCCDKYFRDTGKEIPVVNMDDPEYRSYLLWYDRQMEAFVERIQMRIKTVKPGAALVTWTTNAGRFGHFLEIPHSMPARMNLLFDAPCQEYWMDETNRGPTVVSAFANAYIWAVTNHRMAFSQPYLFTHGNPYGTDSFPPYEVKYRILLALTHGAQGSNASCWNERLNPAAFEMLDIIDKRRHWITHKKPEWWAAMVMSDHTRNFYGRQPGKVEKRYLSNVLGFYRTALEEHMGLAVINDWNLNDKDLSQYKVLILPNTACLNKDQSEAVRKYVQNGGGLVASVDASLCDEIGEQLNNFSLTDVFGVDYKGTIRGGGSEAEKLDSNFMNLVDEEYRDKRKSIFSLHRMSQHEIFNDAKLKAYIGNDDVTFKGMAVAVEVRENSNAKVIATVKERYEGNAKKKSQQWPAVVTNDYGKGRVVYFAAGLDSAYYLYPFPYQRIMLARAMQWVAPEPFGVNIEAPMCVQSTVFRQEKQGQRLVIHLYNDANTTANHAYPVDDVPLREETIPIHNIKIRFSKKYKISRIHLEPGGTPLKPEVRGDMLQVVVPKLKIHSMVVAELQKD